MTRDYSASPTGSNSSPATKLRHQTDSRRRVARPVIAAVTTVQPCMVEYGRRQRNQITCLATSSAAWWVRTNRKLQQQKHPVALAPANCYISVQSPGANIAPLFALLATLNTTCKL